MLKHTKYKQLNVLKTLTNWNKTKVTTYDKLFYYYTIKTPMSLYAHKAFILLEMQLNASLVRMKLVPYLFLVNELCFYRIIRFVLFTFFGIQDGIAQPAQVFAKIIQ